VRPLTSLLASFTLLGLTGCDWLWPTPEATTPDPAEAPAARKVQRNLGGQPALVLFIVIDTVRADHTSLCGYNRPTTPALQALVSGGAAHTCEAYSPAPWTLPSHASYFTGASVTEHATMFVAQSDVAINATITARPLAESYETLAESFAARGYQTVAISANPILNEHSGLLQGFQHTDISATGSTLRGRALGQALKARLAALDPTKPLFLFVNVYDAHDPYPAVPEGVEWLGQQARTRIDAYTHDPSNPYYAFIKGLMPEADRPAYLQTLTNGYDYGVYYADAQVSVIMGMLLRGGWMHSGYRTVVTSDHGEFLGEHGLLRHCGFLWEPVVKVPLVFFDSTRRRQPKLPGPLSAIHAYHLVRDGHLPAAPIPPHSVSEKNPDDILVGTIAGALWANTDKAVCVEGERSLYDLAADPTERAPKPVDGHALAEPLTTLCADIDTLHTLPPPKDDGGKMRDALKAMGYLDDNEVAPPPPTEAPLDMGGR
jgi:hypothetical protein